MPKKAEARLWRDVLQLLAKKGSPEKFTAADITQEFDMEYANAAQLLKRLQGWGHIRQVSFEAPAGGGAGRRRKVYEVTDHGRRAAAYHAKRA